MSWRVVSHFMLLILLTASPALAATGSVWATPTTVTIAVGESVGTTTIGWTSSGATTVHVTVQCNGGAESLFASSGAGTNTQAAPWVSVGSSCLFRLRKDTVFGTLLSSVTVTGVAAAIAIGTILADPTTVAIPVGQSAGTTMVRWSSSGAATLYVTVKCGGGAEGVFASSGPGTASQAAPWITVGANCVFRLRANSATGTLLGTVTVIGVQTIRVTGTIAATPQYVSVPRTATTGAATLVWSSSSPSVELRSVAGGVETSLGSFAGSGTLVLSTIAPGRLYQFRLYVTNQLIAVSAPVQGVHLQVTSRGGSNHVFYHYPPPGSGDDAYNYGVVLHYHEAGVRQTVRDQLRQMYDNGQRAIRVVVWFAHVPGATLTTSPVESSRKCDVAPCTDVNSYFQSVQFRQNLRDYLADIRAQGFERISLALAPQWINDFFSCNDPAVPANLRSQLYAGSPLVNELFEEAWGVTRELRAIAVGSGLPYLIDLSNEYAPPSNLADVGQCAKDIIEGKPGFAGYLRFLWGRYVAAYGTADTVGFSIIVGSAWDADNRLARIPMFLSPLPAVLELHSYSNERSADISAGLNRAYDVVRGFGGVRPWVISETENRSTVSAAAIRSFLQSHADQEIRYVLQWPGFNCSTEQTCLPLDFSAFSAQGL